MLKTNSYLFIHFNFSFSIAFSARSHMFLSLYLHIVNCLLLPLDLNPLS